MSTFNRFVGTLNLTRDIELRYTPKGKAVAELGLASNHTSTDGDGVKHEEVWFGQAVAFGQQGETLAKWFRKGQPITVEGRLRTEQWDDRKTGEKRSTTRLLIERFHFVPGYDYKAQAAAPRSAPAPAAAPSSAPAGGSDDEIPY